MQIIKFSPDGQSPFEFQANLSGGNYSIKVLFNNYSNRYYVQGIDSHNTVVIFTPMVASPDDYDINLAIGFGLLVFRLNTNSFEVS